MTAVRQDKQGLYVIASERVGRPQAGQGAGLREGSAVRAAKVEGGIRVRYAGREELWGEYISRRQAARRERDPEGNINYEVGQQWTQRNGGSVRITEIIERGTPDYREGWRVRCADGGYRRVRGHYWGEQSEDERDLVSLVSQPG